MGNTSLGGLVNLTALNKALKKADVVYWMRSEASESSQTFDYVSNGYFAVKARIPVGANVFATLAGLFGTIPYGKPMQWNRGHGASESNVDLEKILDVHHDVAVVDTTLTAHTGMHDLHVYRAYEHYISVNVLYADMIDEVNDIWANDDKPTASLLFVRGEEKALILPVNTGCEAYFMQYLAKVIG